MRTDSNAKAEEITRLPYGYNLTVLGAKNGWVQVKNDDDMIGYVNGSIRLPFWNKARKQGRNCYC